MITDGIILFAGAMFGPIYALFVEKIGGDLMDASFAFAVFSVTAGIVTIISGRYSDKIKETKNIIVIGYLIMAIGFFGYIFVNSLWSLLIIQVVVGLGEAIYFPAYDAVYSENLSVNKLGRGWAAWEAISYFMAAIGAVAGGFLVSIFGFDAMFIIVSILCLISSIYIFLLPKRVL